MNNYTAPIITYLKSGRATDADWENIGTLLERESECPAGPELNELEDRVFGPRVECPECGSLALPGLLCWGCEDWTAGLNESEVAP